MSQSWGFIVQGVTYGAIYAITAGSLVIIYRATKLFNFAVGSFVVLAGYLTYWFASLGLPYVLAAIVAIIATGALSATFYHQVPRRMVRQAHWVAIVSTLAFSILLDGIMGAIWVGKSFSIETPWKTSLVAVGFDVQVSNVSLVVFGIMALLLLGVAGIMRTRSIGSRFLAAAVDPLVATARGISATRYYVAAWFLGGAMAGLAGVIYGSTQAAGLSAASVAFAAFPAVIIGGLDSVLGAAVAGSALGVVQVLSATYLSSAAFNAIAFGLAIAVLLIRPTGLLGSKEVARL